MTKNLLPFSLRETEKRARVLSNELGTSGLQRIKDIDSMIDFHAQEAQESRDTATSLQLLDTQRSAALEFGRSCECTSKKTAQCSSGRWSQSPSSEAATPRSAISFRRLCRSSCGRGIADTQRR
ncbi:hypothetical protein PHYPSEUDO_010138 [Phytophthora pseudosyringae]|uniref:Uncharacterized protein n=1 Tax=Phytophthora pseudosyringae TaxID=221518 RepID=A0A8T1VBS1_9STRA|nr:hypothetical protein PHYPSEUDO_010138 [Phytophthora pseudosyringae]